MSAPTVASRVLMQVPDLLRQPRVARPGHHSPDLIDPRLRRRAVGWVCVSVPVIVVAGGLAATTADRYLVVLAFVASWVYTTPALAFTYLAVWRAPRGRRAGEVAAAVAGVGRPRVRDRVRHAALAP